VPIIPAGEGPKTAGASGPAAQDDTND